MLDVPGSMFISSFYLASLWLVNTVKLGKLFLQGLGSVLRSISIHCFLSRPQLFAIDLLIGNAYKDFLTTVLKKVEVHPTFAIYQIDRRIGSSQSQCLKNAPKGHSCSEAQSKL